MSASVLIHGRKKRRNRRGILIGAIVFAVVLVFALSLMVGKTLYDPAEILRVVAGQQVPGATFTVGELRLPRATLGVLAGLAFGMAGVTFQTMLRNPLASPDVIGISSGASAAAVIGIVVFSLNETAISLLALAAALVTAGAIYLLASRRGFAGTRLILIGVGVAAMLDSVISSVLSRAASWDLQVALQWLTGSLNGANWSKVVPLACAFLVLVVPLLVQERNLGVLKLGDDSAAALGVTLRSARLTLILCAVGLLAFATAATGPIAFVAFMAGPIAARLLGQGALLILPAGLIGALLVLVADFCGQYAFGTRYPVGVVTGVLGAPFLIFLLIRMNRSGGSL